MRAIVWDLSGVLTEESPVDHGSLARRCELPSWVFREVLRDYCNVERGWDRVERGELTLEAFSVELASRVRARGGRCTPGMARTLWGDPDPFSAARRVRTELFPVIRRLHADFGSYLCTNNTRAWRPIWSRMVPAGSLFDRVFESCELGMRKPERRFFAHIEREIGLSGEEILFIDDRRENVVAAAALCGWRTIAFEDTPSCLAALGEITGVRLEGSE